MLKKQLKLLLERQRWCCPLEIMLLLQKVFFLNSKNRVQSPPLDVNPIDYGDFARAKIFFKKPQRLR